MDLRTKLQLGAGQKMLGVDVPVDLVVALGDSLTTGADDAPGDALLVFVADQAGLEPRRSQVVASARDDRLTWVAYPKAGRLGTDLNRDRLAASLTVDGVRPVRQVALDEVWSALRFRPA